MTKPHLTCSKEAHKIVTDEVNRRQETSNGLRHTNTSVINDIINYWHKRVGIKFKKSNNNG